MGVGGSQRPFSSSSAAGSRYLDSPELGLSYLKSIYGPLKRHYDWFRRTQRGQIKQYSRKARSRTEAYRWRGRSQQHVLTSGMDDYPRGPPHAGELHLDLISWMGFFTRTMREIADFIGEADDAASFGEIEKGIIQNIDGECKSRPCCCILTPFMQTCTGTKRGRCIATSTLMMTVRTEYTHIYTNPMRLHRRIISRLPRRLPLPVPVHALAAATELPPCRCHFADAS